MIKIECQLMDRTKDGHATALGYVKIEGDNEILCNELRVVFKQLEGAVGELVFAEALDDWLKYEKEFKA